VTILNYFSVRFLQQLLLGNFKFCHAVPHRSIAASQHASSVAARLVDVLSTVAESAVVS
jgi:hypothetical protein